MQRVNKGNQENLKKNRTLKLLQTILENWSVQIKENVCKNTADRCVRWLVIGIILCAEQAATSCVRFSVSLLYSMKNIFALIAP